MRATLTNGPQTEMVGEVSVKLCNCVVATLAEKDNKFIQPLSSAKLFS